MLALKVKSGDKGRFGNSGVEGGEVGQGGFCLFGAADPNVVRDTEAEEVVTGVGAQDGAEFVLEIVLRE